MRAAILCPLLLLALPAVLAAQITSTLSGVPCSRLAEPPPSPGQLDSLRHRDPDADADAAFAEGEHRLWARN